MSWPYLTDLGDYDEEHQAWLYNKASLLGVDSFFNQVCRRISLIERPSHSKSNNGLIWNGYSPYNTGNVAKVIDIMSTVRSYILTFDRQGCQDASLATFTWSFKWQYFNAALHLNFLKKVALQS